MKRTICFIAQFPPPMHGLSKAVETLYNSKLAQEFNFEKINISDNKKFLSTILMIRRSKADLFYFTISQSIGGNLRDLLILKAIGNRPCLIHLHGGYYRKLVDNDLCSFQRKANYRAIRKVQGTIVLGPSLKWIFNGMISSEKIFVVPNCVDDEYLMTDEEFEDKVRKLPMKKIRHVLYLSNFIRTKGYPEVLEMAKEEKNRCEKGGVRKLHFDFAGRFFENSEREYFQKYITENGLDDYVTYHGIVDGEKKRKLLRQCEVFALLTTYPKEGQPISILEAMGNGMVIVTTNHAGIPDIVKKESGITVNAETVAQGKVYSRILSLKLKDYEEMIYTNRSIVINKYNECEYIHNMKRCFDTLLASS